MKVANKKRNVEEHIDDVIISHIIEKSDLKKYGDYIDLDEYEKYRVILQNCYDRRRERSINRSQTQQGNAPVSLSQHVHNSIEL